MTIATTSTDPMRLRIMVVEDEPDIRVLMAQMLGNQYEIVQADNGLEALERLNWYQPDLTIMDLMMPILDGFDTTRAIKKDAEYAAMPVMFLTARKDNQAVRAALMAGGDVYLEKPFDPPELLTRLQEMITRGNIKARAKRYTSKQIQEHFEAAPEKTKEPSPHRREGAMSLTEQLARAAAEPKARILAIIESDILQQSIKQELKNRYEIIFANEPESALDKIIAYQPDIIVIPIKMGTLNGFQLAQLMQVNRQLKVPNILFLSDSNDEFHRAEADRLGGSLLSGNPPNTARIIDEINRITAGAEFQRQRKRLDYREILRREQPEDDDDF